MNQEEIYRTIVGIIGVMYAGNKEYITEGSGNYQVAKDFYDNEQYDLLLIFALALVDNENYIRFESKKLESWKNRIKELKKKNYSALSIVNIMKDEI